VVTAIGPVHLERMKRLEVIEAAKYEITERASVVIVNVMIWCSRVGPHGSPMRARACAARVR